MKFKVISDQGNYMIKELSEDGSTRKLFDTRFATEREAEEMVKEYEAMPEEEIFEEKTAAQLDAEVVDAIFTSSQTTANEPTPSSDELPPVTGNEPVINEDTI